MKTGSLGAVLALALLAGPYAYGFEDDVLAKAKPASVGLSAAKLERIEGAVARLIEGDKLAGAVVIVVRRGKVVFEGAFGASDRARQKDMQLDTIFRIYSMTKPVVSVAAMILHEEGQFELDDPVSKYLPAFGDLKVYVGGRGTGMKMKDPARAMTVRDLLRHTSGLTYGLFGNTPVDRLYRQTNLFGQPDLAAMVDKLGELPLLSSPGERWTYSVSCDVLGRLIEVVSQQPLDVFLQKRVFAPLGMVDTGFFVPQDKAARLSANYGPGRRGLRVMDDPARSSYLRKPKILSGGGGLVSTLRDYARFCQMLMGKGRLGKTRLLAAKTVEEMTRDQLPEEAFPIGVGFKRPGVGFGLGFSVRVKKSLLDSASRVGEYGWGGAASTHFWISPRDELFVVALSQHMPFSPQLEAALKPIVYAAIQ